MNDAVTSHELYLACNTLRSEFEKELADLRPAGTHVPRVLARVENLEKSFVKLSDLVDRLIMQLMDLET